MGKWRGKHEAVGESDLEQGPARHYAGILKYQKFHNRLIPFTINKKKTIESLDTKGYKRAI